MFQVSTAKTAVEKQINTKDPNFESDQSENVGPVRLGYYDRLENMFRLLVYLMCYSVNMMRWAGRASMVTMNQEELNMSSKYEDRRTSGGPFEPDKLLNEDPPHENKNPRFVQAITDKIWKVLQFLYFPPPLLRWWHTDGNMEVKDMYAYRGELTQLTSERELHEPQHVPVDQGGGHQHLPLLHEPDYQGDVVQVKPLYEPDDKEHNVNDLIPLIPAYAIDLQLLPQPIDQGGGDVHHDIAEHQVCGVDRM